MAYHFFMNILLPMTLSILAFVLGARIGGRRKMRKAGFGLCLGAAAVFAWGWSIISLLGLPNPLEIIWWTMLAVAASGLPAGIACAAVRCRRWVAAVPTAAVFVYLLFSFGLACATARAPEAPTGPHFRVLGFNVNWGGPKPDLAVQAIAGSDADIVCLQETNPAWEELLRKTLAAKYPRMLFRHFSGAGGKAFLSRLPIREIRYVTEKAGWFPGWVVEVQTPSGTVHVMNVHLRPPLSDRGGFSLGALYSTKDIRLQEVKDLHAHLDEKLPTIVMGDFNENTSGAAAGWFKSRGMTDAVQEFDPYGKTWHWNTSLGTFSACFDHIFYSAHLHCVEADIIKEGASDHYPVTAVFQMKK
jgi:endonuclease/exonuclease/phosphatase (EEP) superfamily protein YafD